MIDRDFVNKVQREHFRTDQDTGANPNALLIWNLVRKHAGMSPITLDDLPTYCEMCSRYHYPPVHN